MANQNGGGIQKTGLSEFKLRLTGPKREGQKRPPMLSVQVIKNNPRIDVFTNDDQDKKDYGRISAPMDGITFFTFLATLDKAIEGEKETVYKIANKVGAPNNQKTISHTLVGKDAEGRVFMSVTAQDRPKIKFTFLPSDWHNFAFMDGTPVGEAELSQMVARGWSKLMTELVANVMDTHYVEPEPRNGGGGGNRGGNYNRGGGNNYNNGGGSNESDFSSGDADFPM